MTQRGALPRPRSRLASHGVRVPGTAAIAPNSNHASSETTVFVLLDERSKLGGLVTRSRRTRARPIHSGRRLESVNASTHGRPVPSFKPTSRRSSHVRTGQDRLARHWTRDRALQSICPGDTGFRHLQVPDLLDDPGLDRVLRGAQDPDAPAAVLDHRKDVYLRAIEQVSGEEAQRQDPLRLGSQELRPARAVPAGRVAAGFWQISQASVTWTYTSSLPGIIMIGIGAALVIPSATASVMGSLSACWPTARVAARRVRPAAGAGHRDWAGGRGDRGSAGHLPGVPGAHAGAGVQGPARCFRKVTACGTPPAARRPRRRPGRTPIRPAAGWPGPAVLPTRS